MYQVNIFYSDEDSGYIANIPDLAYCSAFGETPEAALREVETAKSAWLEAAEAEGKPIPQPRHRPAILPNGMTQQIKLLDVVALLEDVPQEGLVRGQVGTVVEQYAPGAFEVEFSDGEGRTYAQIVLRPRQLLVLRHGPVSD